MPLRVHIELVYEPGCPHVREVRTVLATACRSLGIPAVWSEWTTEDRGCPGHLKALGSPSVVVNGRDVAPGAPSWATREVGDGPPRRVYPDGPRILPIPPVQRVVGALEEALGPAAG